MRGLLLALLLLAPAVPAAPRKPPAREAPRPSLGQPFPEEVRRALDALVRAELARGPHAGLSVGVLQGERAWTGGYGLRDRTRRLPATPRTTYRMASITKSFTAVAVMQLVEQGLLELDEDIRARVPRWPEHEWPVTVRQLLGHLGGVSHYDGPESAENARRLDTAGALALFADKPLVAEPDTKFVYTTWGYNLLGAAVESASGRAYGDWLKAHVFGPAGMAHAALDEHRTRDEHHAVGYRQRRGRLERSRFLDVSSRFAGGGTRASVEDLLAFGRAMVEHRLVSPASAGLMQASQRTRDGALTDYGLGFAAYPLRGHYVVAHAGGQPETTALLVMVPAEGLVLALATNLEGEARRLRRLSQRMMELLLEDGRVRRDAHLVDPVDAVVHEGLYRLFTYGLSYHQWATRGPGALPKPGNLEEAFTRVSALLERSSIAEDVDGALRRVREAHEPRGESLFIRVGAHMARVLEEAHGPERLREYPVLGPLDFFTDYLGACEQVGCPPPLRFDAALREDARHFQAVWRRTQVSELLRTRLDEVADPEALWPTLAAAIVGEVLHPDFAEEMLHVASVHGRRGRKDVQLRWLERAVALHPRSMAAREALARLRPPLRLVVPVPLPSLAPPPSESASPVPDDAGLLPERAVPQGR